VSKQLHICRSDEYREPPKPGAYVYVVCANRSDHFAEMAAVSITTLRMASPRARIIILTDLATSILDSPGVSVIRAAANDFMIVDCPGDSSFSRSRFIKSNMRRLVNGRFVYLDSDTIIMKSPDAIWQIDCDVAASPDLGSDGKPYMCENALPETSAVLGWALASRQYLNSGVIYFADSEAAHAVGEQYRLSWSEHLRVTGKANDQLAFNRAVDVARARLTIIPGSYNAQISMNVMTLRHATIVHFYTGGFERSLETVAHTAAKRLKSDGTLALAAIQSAVLCGNPWTRIDSFHKAAATGRYWDVGRVVLDCASKRLWPKSESIRG
jgi:hypothetical protein